MFVCDCSECGRRELRGPRSLYTLPTADGAVFAARCRGCGADVPLTTRPLTDPRSEPATAA